MAKQLDKPISEIDFQQLTLVANAIAVFQFAIQLEKPGSERRRMYADALMRVKRIESAIPGHMEGRTIDDSKRFYNRINDASIGFLKSFRDAQPVGRDSRADGADFSLSGEIL